jgi:hypothetical protein
LLQIIFHLTWDVLAASVSSNLGLGMPETDSQGCVAAAMVCQEHVFIDIFHSKICYLAQAVPYSSGLYKALFAPENSGVFCCSTPTGHILEGCIFILRSYDVCCLRVVDKTYVFNVCKLTRFAIKYDVFNVLYFSLCNF